MKKTFVGTLLLLTVSVVLSAIDVSGRIESADGDPIPDATVILLDTDEMAVTGEDGRFVFPDTTVGQRPVMVIAPGYEELTAKLTITGVEELLIDLVVQVVEMETIVATAEALPSDPPGRATVDREALETAASGGNPFDIVDGESGILNQRGIAGGDSGAITEEMLPLGMLSAGGESRVSVYGGSSDWNTYLYDYMRLPANRHAYGTPTPPPVVPQDAVESLEIFKGVAPVHLGSGIGWTFRLVPINDLDDNFRITIRPSILDINANYMQRFGEDSGMLLFVHQAIDQWTVQPLISATAEKEDGEADIGDRVFTGGDALLHVFLRSGPSLLTFDVLGYYDVFQDKVDSPPVSLDDDGYPSVDTWDLGSNPYFATGGVKWVFSPRDLISLTLFSYASTYRRPFDYTGGATDSG